MMDLEVPRDLCALLHNDSGNPVVEVTTLGTQWPIRPRNLTLVVSDVEVRPVVKFLFETSKVSKIPFLWMKT